MPSVGTRPRAATEPETQARTQPQTRGEVKPATKVRVKPITTPDPRPGVKPQEFPELKQPKPPPPTKTKTKLKTPPSLSDEQKRRVIAEADTKAAWVQGKLHSKPVIHVIFGKNGVYDHTVLLGAPPEGTVMAEGKGQAYRSITLTHGVPPSRPVQIEGGAVDATISPTRTGRGVTIRFVHDDSVRPRKERAQFRINRKSLGPGRSFDLGADIVSDRRGRHLRL